ncbi:MAG: hypothetical protein DRP08_07015 [Candidatus Aenigmatarchaeota archaeon]|nr:MAG: hypothetical protein DRP08_07015 [Candidatus Aenigmarchaeota archaeon]
MKITKTLNNLKPSDNTLDIPMKTHATLKQVADWLALERNLVIMVLAVLVLTFGNQMWVKFTPKYLEFLGASAIILGLYGSIEQFVGAIYQYPGGIITDRLGAKRALILFSFISIIGYIIYYFSYSWELFIIGTFFVLVWESMSQPAIFSLIGDVLSKSKRAMGFSVQSILKRIPIIIAPPIGGYFIQTYGLQGGMRIGFVVSIVMALLAIFVQRKYYTETGERKENPSISIIKLWQIMDKKLKKLLISDILARMASYMIKVYIVIYVINILKATPLDYGLMISIQMTTSILSYLPAAKLADKYGRKPFITLTFLFFSLFPLILVQIPSPTLLPLAFIIAGLREIGEPARKAYIVDLSEGEYKGKTIGLYYLIRELTNLSSPIIGGILWTISPKILFYTSFFIGLTGVTIFSITNKLK